MEKLQEFNTIALGTVPNNFISTDSASTDSVPKDFVSTDSVPKDFVSKNSVSNDSVLKDSVATDSCSKRSVALGDALENTVSKELSQMGTVPQNIKLQNTAPQKALKKFFGYDAFRTYNNVPLQEDAVRSALAGESLIAVFPTGGGKSITFQLPALVEWERTRALTVVISPLQSLMKDQVDNLEKRHITNAATINGLINKVERANIISRVKSGDIAILYISPEQLRSGSFLHLMQKRKIARFVIDEAHCFSVWGHDFRVDYLYIAEFIQSLIQSKQLKSPIPISCFTATAKRQVIEEIENYFFKKLGISLLLFQTDAERKNLHYHVTECRDENEKYATMCKLIREKKSPTIIYVSRTKRAEELASRLISTGINACYFHGQMDVAQKIKNQNDFLANEKDVMVATSAFGMGVDKSDVALIIHYDISLSLEAYLQESGRAGRDSSIDADCYILYNENDLDENFALLQYSQIMHTEINRVWRVIKKLTTSNPMISSSAYEIGCYAGFYSLGENREDDIKTKVTVAISALEHAGFVRRISNAPISFANSLKESDSKKAKEIIMNSSLLSIEEKKLCIKLMAHLIAAHEEQMTGEEKGEGVMPISQIDQFSMYFKMPKRDVLHYLNLLREIDLLANDLDITAKFTKDDSIGKVLGRVGAFNKLEAHLFSYLNSNINRYSLKRINDKAKEIDRGEWGIQNIRLLLDFHKLCRHIKLQNISETDSVDIELLREKDSVVSEIEVRYKICKFILHMLFENLVNIPLGKKEVSVVFSVLSIVKEYKKAHPNEGVVVKQQDVENAILFMMKIGALNLSGGFLVGYNRLQIERLMLSNATEYTDEHYKGFKNFYMQKNEAIHIMGEYARLMIKTPLVAQRFVKDYFELNFDEFINKHFKDLHVREIKRSLSPKKYDELFGDLSVEQRKIIEDTKSKIIVVAAGPGSGKTRVLTKKIAASVFLQGIATNQILMLTLSRGATHEFKARLMGIIGANDVEIKTFHSYSLDVAGVFASHNRGQSSCGSNSEENSIVMATEMINNGVAEPYRVTKSILILDEAQDIGKEEFALIKALMKQNPDMRVIAVGDDDQNIYEFRGSNGKYFRNLSKLKGAKVYELIENYRSANEIVAFANAFASTIEYRLKKNASIAKSSIKGSVEICEYVSADIEMSLIDCLLSNRYSENGSCAILTHSNDEASVVAGELFRRGVPVKFIHSDDHIKLYNLAELRYFMRCLESENGDFAISHMQWIAARERMQRKYSISESLPLCNKILDKFEKEHYGVEGTSLDTEERRELGIAANDFSEYLYDAEYEDFEEESKNKIIVSTFHKAKGREFDSVYILVKDFNPQRDETRRILYVALTRAKSKLYIHSNTQVFSGLKDYAIKYTTSDAENLPIPDNLVFQLTHRDLDLGYFYKLKKEILSLQSGHPLVMKGNLLYANTRSGNIPVAKFSRSFREKLYSLRNIGYVVSEAKVWSILAWRSNPFLEESAVLLPTVKLIRRK